VTGPFAALGLPDSPAPGDDDVRSAWRRIAAATHPDRSDGGDPAGFAAAAAAYAQLRTASGRREALADRAGPGPGGQRVSEPGSGALVAGRPRPGGRGGWRHVTGRIGRCHRLRLVLPLLAATAAGAIAVLAVGWQPASLAIITGALTWLVRTRSHNTR
jgi:curved DNA-binding protein CbpA